MKKNDKSEAELLEMIRDLEVRQFELETQNKELIKEREKAATALSRQNDALSKLYHFSLELSRLPSEDNLEVLIAKRIREFTGASMASFSEYNAESQILTVRHIEMEPGLLEKATSILGENFRKMQVPVSDKLYREISTEIIVTRKTLNEATFGVISRQVGTTVQTLFKVDRFISVAYTAEGNLFGTSLLAMHKEQPDPPGDIFLDFVSIASLSLRRKR